VSIFVMVSVVFGPGNGTPSASSSMTPTRRPI
jgi:hypothetical protein